MNINRNRTIGKKKKEKQKDEKKHEQVVKSYPTNK